MGKKHKEHRSAPGLGATYQAAKMSVQVLGPPVYSVASYGRGVGVGTALKDEITHPNYLKGVAVSLVDAYASKKIGHAAALSRRSITAWAPELLVGSQTALATRDPVQMGVDYIARTDGYNAADRSFDAGRVWQYGVAKYGLGAARKFGNRARILEPLKTGVRMFGLAI